MDIQRVKTQFASVNIPFVNIMQLGPDSYQRGTIVEQSITVLASQLARVTSGPALGSDAVFLHLMPN